MTLEEIRKELVGKDLCYDNTYWRIKNVVWDKVNHYYVVLVDALVYVTFVFSKGDMSRLIKSEGLEEPKLLGHRYRVFRSLSKENFKSFLSLVREMRDKQRECLDSGDEEREVDKFIEDVDRGSDLE